MRSDTQMIGMELIEAVQNPKAALDKRVIHTALRGAESGTLSEEHTKFACRAVLRSYKEYRPQLRRSRPELRESRP